MGKERKKPCEQGGGRAWRELLCLCSHSHFGIRPLTESLIHYVLVTARQTPNIMHRKYFEFRGKSTVYFCIVYLNIFQQNRLNSALKKPERPVLKVAHTKVLFGDDKCLKNLLIHFCVAFVYKIIYSYLATAIYLLIFLVYELCWQVPLRETLGYLQKRRELYV